MTCCLEEEVCDMNESNEIDLEAMLERIRTQAAAEDIRITQHAQQEDGGRRHHAR
jgi:hypothetical protein